MMNAEFARAVARMSEMLSQEVARHCEGMWNPNYCKAEATNAGEFFAEVRAQATHWETRARSPETSNG